MTTTNNLSIVDSLIRSHFGSNLWTKITDINFFSDDRIRQINHCFKDLPVKSKLYILMALGNLDNTQFSKWKTEVESIFLRAMVEGNLLVRAIATILQQKFALNYLTFDISLSLENFADILMKLSSNTDDWDVNCDWIVAEYISENVVQSDNNNLARNSKIKSRKRRLEIEEKSVDDNRNRNIGCQLKNPPRSLAIKDHYLRKIELECNKKRISVPIPGRNRFRAKEESIAIDNDDKDWQQQQNQLQIQQKRDLDTLKTKKDSEINARLEDIKKRLQQKQSIGGKRESKVICLSIDELPPSGPKARQMIREKEKEAKRLEKEEKLKKLREEKEAEKCRKQQEKESKRLATQKMLEQAKMEKLNVANPIRQLELEEVIELDHEEDEDEEPEELDGGDNEDEEEDEDLSGKHEILSSENGFVSIPLSLGGNYRSISIQNNQPQFVGSLQPIQLEQRSFNQNVSPITIIGPHGVFRPPGSHLISVPLSQQPQGAGAPIQHQPHQQQIVLIQQPQQSQPSNNPISSLSSNSHSNTNTAASNQYILSANAPGGMKLVRLVTAPQAGTTQASPNSQPRLLRIITTPQPNAASGPTVAGNKSRPGGAPGSASAFTQPQMATVAIGSNSASGNNTSSVPISQQPQSISLNPQSMQLETMKILIRYANRLTRPQKAMIVSYIAGSTDGVDFNGQSSVHISSHRAVCLETFQPLNVIVDAYFLMDYHTGRWSIAKKYREPRPEEDICALDLQPNGYPPEFSMQA